VYKKQIKTDPKLNKNDKNDLKCYKQGDLKLSEDNINLYEKKSGAKGAANISMIGYFRKEHVIDNHLYIYIYIYNITMSVSEITSHNTSSKTDYVWTFLKYSYNKENRNTI